MNRKFYYNQETRAVSVFIAGYSEFDVEHLVEISEGEYREFFQDQSPIGKARSVTHPFYWIDTKYDYIAEYDAIDSKRRSLYTQMSDPLYSKARRLERNGEIEKANDYYAQADAAVDKIKSENPWPLNPEA
jgi:hypothetical protein